MNTHKKQEWFQTWFDTTYYHLLYQDRNEEEANRFVEILLNHLQLIPQASVLDAGCGNGRYSVSLASKNLNVMGIDLSRKNIEQASSNESDKLTFFIHDMREIFYVNYFDAVFNLFTSFGYFNTEKENLKAIRALSQSLKKGGKLVIDFFNSKKVMHELPDEQQIFRGGIHFNIKKHLEENVIVKNISFSDNGKDFEFQERVQALTLEDFERYFSKNDLVIKNVFGDHELNTFDVDSSEQMILIAEKI